MSEANVTHMKCAHDGCLCVFETGEGFEKDGRLYCGEECAEHGGCGHRGCLCGRVADTARYRTEGVGSAGGTQ